MSLFIETVHFTSFLQEKKKPIYPKFAAVFQSLTLVPMTSLLTCSEIEVAEQNTLRVLLSCRAPNCKRRRRRRTRKRDHPVCTSPSGTNGKKSGEEFRAQHFPASNRTQRYLVSIYVGKCCSGVKHSNVTYPLSTNQALYSLPWRALRPPDISPKQKPHCLHLLTYLFILTVIQMTELNKMVTSNRRPLITSRLRWAYVHRVQKKMMLLHAVYFSSMNL